MRVSIQYDGSWVEAGGVTDYFWDALASVDDNPQAFARMVL